MSVTFENVSRDSDVARDTDLVIEYDALSVQTRIQQQFAGQVKMQIVEVDLADMSTIRRAVDEIKVPFNNTLVYI